MASKVSAPALRVAIEILREYTLQPQPEKCAVGMNGSEGHVAIVIDHASGVYKIAALRPELLWWQRQLAARRAEAPQLARYLKKLLEVFQEIPQYKPTERPSQANMDVPMEWMAYSQAMYLSKSSVEVGRFINHYYTITPTAMRDFEPKRDLTRIAQIAEINLGLTGAMGAIPLARNFLERIKNGKATEREVRVCFRDLGALLESMPNYKERQEEMKFVTTS